MSDQAQPIGVEEPPEPEQGKKPWIWVPSLYFAESVPNAVVSDTAKFMYTAMQLSPERLGVITGSMYLAWVVKPLWSPLVDLVKTKRWWIISMQLLLAACFVMLGLSLHTPSWLLLSAVVLWLMAFTSATHDIAADGFYMLGLSDRHQAAFTGVRGTFYKLGMIFAKGAMLALAGEFVERLGLVQGWSTLFFAPAALYLGLALYHAFVLPRPARDVSAGAAPPPGQGAGFTPVDGEPARESFAEGYVASFRTFFAKKGLWTAIAFMLLFRFPEAQLLAMVAPFLTGAVADGALGLSAKQVGLAYGTVGVAGSMIGGISGGWVVARYGLRKMFWPLALLMHLPNGFFLYLAMAQPTELSLISGCLFIEQFGYGFGFTIYMLYMLYFAKGERQTSHFAISTGFMAASLMIPQMFSGYILKALGFTGFFAYIMACMIPSFWVAWLAWRNQEFLDTFPAAER